MVLTIGRRATGNDLGQRSERGETSSVCSLCEYGDFMDSGRSRESRRQRTANAGAIDGIIDFLITKFELR